MATIRSVVSDTSIAEDGQHRKGIEAALIALHRLEIDRSPTANFGRIIEGYEQSSYRKDAQRSGQLPFDAIESNAAEGVGPTEWRNVGMSSTASGWASSGPSRVG